MNSQDFRNLQEAYLDVYYELDEGAAGDVAARAQKLANQKKGQTPERKKIYQDLANKARERDEAQNPNPMLSVGSSRFEYNQKHGRPLITPEVSQSRSSQGTLGGVTYQRGPKRLPKSQRKYDRQVLSGVRAASEQEKQRARERMGIKEDIYDIILSHLLDEGYADTQEQAEVIMVNMSEEWRDDIMEKEDSEYEKASDAALDARYGYGRASGDKHSFGRAANRSSAAAALRAIRRGQRSGSGTSTEAGANAVHQGWAHTARTSSDQTPEKKERRAKLADTPYSNLPNDEQEKDRVSFNAVRAVYNNRNRR